MCWSLHWGALFTGIAGFLAPSLACRYIVPTRTSGSAAGDFLKFTRPSRGTTVRRPTAYFFFTNRSFAGSESEPSSFIVRTTSPLGPFNVTFLPSTV
jgi:hypothetical protein